MQVTKVLNLEVTTEESVTDISKQKLLTVFVTCTQEVC